MLSPSPSLSLSLCKIEKEREKKTGENVKEKARTMVYQKDSCNFCVLVGGCYSASSESFPSWSRWDVLRYWVVTISSWHRWRLRRLGEKNSKRNLRTKVTNQIKLNFNRVIVPMVSSISYYSLIFKEIKFDRSSKQHYSQKLVFNEYWWNPSSVFIVTVIRGVSHSSSCYFHFTNWRIVNK